MTRKDPSGQIPKPTLEHDTTRGHHPCLTCRQFDEQGLVPQCAAGAHWFMLKRPDWHCYGFEREPGDQ